MNEKEVGEKLASNIGRFVKISQESSKEARRKYIRVRVEINIDEPVITGFFLNQPNREPLWIIVKYERLPKICSSCGWLWCEGGCCSSNAVASDYPRVRELEKAIEQRTNQKENVNDLGRKNSPEVAPGRKKWKVKGQLILN
ncbi:hypothetical protein QQ045_012739 [Rhodiola kirilowii]